MVIKEIVQIGNPIIRKKSKGLNNKEIKSQKTKKIVRDLIHSMYHYDLVGISAPQINYNIRIFVVEVTKSKKGTNKDLSGLMVFINPKIDSLSKNKASGYEGCGSVSNANLFGLVNRPNSLKIKAQDLNGEYFEFSASGLLARVIQHEYDHLDGILFIDKVKDSKSYMSGTEYMKKFKK